jgi:secreted trypsin-like serine protease
MFPSNKFIMFVAICSFFSVFAEKQRKISNGDEANIIEFPYLVSFQSGSVQICSGSVLNENFILSTARCFVNQRLNELSIEFGLTVINLGETSLNRRNVNRVIIHEDFQNILDETVLNDISLVQPDSSIKIGYQCAFAKLPVPGSSSHFIGKTATIVGWGQTRANQRTNRLHKAEQKILSSEECLTAVGDKRRPNENNICSVGNESVICIGDLGIPLVHNGIVVGLASFSDSPNCASVVSNFPNIFTDVSKYVSATKCENIYRFLY